MVSPPPSPLPSFCVSPSLSLPPVPLPRDYTLAAMRFQERSLHAVSAPSWSWLSTCCDQVDNGRGKVLHEHVSWSLTGYHPAHFLIPGAPARRTERSQRREGGWLVANGLAWHPSLGSSIVQEVIKEGAQRRFGCNLIWTKCNIVMLYCSWFHE